MVYFRINGLGYNCGYDKTKCPKEKLSCQACIINKLKELGFDIDFNLEISEIDFYDKNHEIIWQKFLDVLNIKHIILIDRESGLTLLNYAVSGVDIDTNLLSGFIQANIIFSESSGVNQSEVTPFQYNFYEFQYKNFNILLKEGNIIRICLILDHKASDKLRATLFNFIEVAESRFGEELLEFREKRHLDFDELIESIIKSFNVRLVFPMTIAHSIPPHELENIKGNLIQKAIFNIAKELLNLKSFFFINNILDRIKKIVELKDASVIYNIYQLLEKQIIIPTSIETIASNIETIQDATYKQETKIKPISSIIINDADVDVLKHQIKDLDHEASIRLLKSFIKKGKNAEKDLAYQIAKKEYNKAMYIAKELDLREELAKISQKAFNLEQKSKQIELEFIISKAESAEKNGDFINSINYYQQALKIFEGFLVYNIVDPRIKKFKKKIQKLREEI